MSPFVDANLMVNGNEVARDANPVLTVAGAYVSGDYVGTSGVAMVFANAACGVNRGGYVFSAMVADAANQKIAGELWLFDTAVTPPNDNAAFTLSAADRARAIAVIPFSTYYADAAGGVSFGQCDGSFKEFFSATGNLFGCFVTRGTPTYASLNLTFRLTVLQK